MTEGACGHIEAIRKVKQPKRRECEDCMKIGSAVAPPPDLPGVRRHAMLRRLAEPPREPAREGRRAIP